MNCGTNVDDCAGITCGSGQCVDGVDAAFCDCPPGKSGLDCSKTSSRDLDLEIAGPSHVLSVYPFALNCSALTIGVWVKYSMKDGQGSFLQFYLTS